MKNIQTRITCVGKLNAFRTYSLLTIAGISCILMTGAVCAERQSDSPKEENGKTENHEPKSEEASMGCIKILKNPVEIGFSNKQFSVVVPEGFRYIGMNRFYLQAKDAVQFQISETKLSDNITLNNTTDEQINKYFSNYTVATKTNSEFGGVKGLLVVLIPNPENQIILGGGVLFVGEHGGTFIIMQGTWNDDSGKEVLKKILSSLSRTPSSEAIDMSTFQKMYDDERKSKELKQKQEALKAKADAKKAQEQKKVKDERTTQKCPYCQGRGIILSGMRKGARMETESCPECGGTGKRN